MASNYSLDLRLELIGSGEQSGVWGSTTNLNLGSLIEQAIAGVQTIAITSADQALTAFYGAVDQSRNAALVLNSSSAANVYVPPVSKVYVVQNAGSFPITMYNSTVLGNTTQAGAGVTVASGVTTFMFTDGTSFYIASTPAGPTTGTGNLVFSVSPVLTGIPTTPTANAGTNTTQIATTAFVGAAVSVNAANVAITGGSITGITDLAVADGGTGASTFTSNSIVLGNGTSALNGNMVAPSTSGNVLTSNGTTWTSSALSSLSVFDKSLTTNGYQKLPGGLIMQWGQIDVGLDSTAVVTWPIAFPSACFQAVCCHGYAFAVLNDAGAAIYDLTTTTANIRNGSNAGGPSTMRWMAFGN